MMMRASLLCLLAFASTSVSAESELELAKREGRYEMINITLSDGTPLSTVFVLPRGVSFSDVGANVTTVLDRSPYGHDALELMADLYLPLGMAAVGQDMRGTENSGGEFSIWHSDAIDGAETIDYIASQVWSSGTVLSFGASADGLASFTLLDSAPKPLDSQFIIWSSSQGYPIIFPGGAYSYNLVDTWMRDTVRPYDVDRCLEEITDNEKPGDWWEPLNMTIEGGNYDKVTWPTLLWAGWYDIFLVGQLSAYQGFKDYAAPMNNNDIKIFIDPLGHCQEAGKEFPQHTIAGRSALPFLMSYDLFASTVNGKEWGNATDEFMPYRSDIKDVTFYVMGSTEDGAAGNYWTTLDAFPKTTPTTLFLNSDGTVSSEAKDAAGASIGSYKHDPTDPVPSFGGNNLFMPCGPHDQTPNFVRDDVLLYTSDVFESPVAITGHIKANLKVTSDAIDTDFFVKLMDVYPTGEHKLLQVGAVRMRNTINKDMIAGEEYDVELNMWNTSFVFNTGHSLAVSIASSNYPRFSINPNNGRALSDPEIFSNNVTATNAIRAGSTVTIPVVRLHDMPRAHVIEEINDKYAELGQKAVELAELFKGGRR